MPSARRPVVWTTIAALLMTTSGSPLMAAPASSTAAAKASREITDFSARRYHRHYRGGNAAGLAFMGLAIGAIAGAVAAERRRDYYESHRYYYGPGYYGPPPGYYGGPYYGHPYYAPY